MKLLKKKDEIIQSFQRKEKTLANFTMSLTKDLQQQKDEKRKALEQLIHAHTTCYHSNKAAAKYHEERSEITRRALMQEFGAEKYSDWNENKFDEKLR